MQETHHHEYKQCLSHLNHNTTVSQLYKRHTPLLAEQSRLRQIVKFTLLVLAIYMYDQLYMLQSRFYEDLDGPFPPRQPLVNVSVFAFKPKEGLSWIFAFDYCEHVNPSAPGSTLKWLWERRERVQNTCFGG